MRQVLNVTSGKASGGWEEEKGKMAKQDFHILSSPILLITPTLRANILVTLYYTVSWKGKLSLSLLASSSPKSLAVKDSSHYTTPTFIISTLFEIYSMR
ncbi:hypothetical protein X798_01342 [Onchocerca flexuosa]|uniref:Ovule protein n=2 Tax=Onchocerca flexuosa TaxID=387005 RepID=A0A183H5R5_9BILA|nr:hypothetical protein X798_01342 [Onchocerca flexuosa]VDO34350.1 unnamed protein product [Onchocerca flexuosa]